MAKSPGTPQNIEQLEDLLSEPTPGAIDTMARLEGDLVILGGGLVGVGGETTLTGGLHDA